MSGELNLAIYAPSDREMIQHAMQLAQLIGEDKRTEYGQCCFQQGSQTAEILTHLQVDAKTIAAGVLYSVFEYADLSPEIIAAQLNPAIASLIQSVSHMSAIQVMTDQKNKHYLDRLRKMFLTMVKDIRAVVIKLADHLVNLKYLRKQESDQKLMLARQTMDIFAPLANRLGLYQIKWELEDLAFYSLNPKDYLIIAKQLDASRENREARVTKIIAELENLLKADKIFASIHGRAKHIYSIFRKLERKQMDFSKIYDDIAVRVLTDTIPHCYEILSKVHHHWIAISKEFDDYIAVPKPNGYQSIHTAVLDAENRHFEIQIRTQEMHEVSERGIAAHWKYKEGKSHEAGLEEKIQWLRQVLSWQKEQSIEGVEKNIVEDRVYVFTPRGDIIDLPNGATPLDFAYHIHTEVGHRCRGAKVNGSIVPLTYRLKTTDRVDILTSKISSPSRDWLLPKEGYLKTATARAKVLQWFKNVEPIEKAEEMVKTGVPLSTKFATNKAIKKTEKNNLIQVMGLNHLQAKLAKCCKPLLGDPIVGYITRDQGVSVHHENCKNIQEAKLYRKERLVDVTWNHLPNHTAYLIDLDISGYDRPRLLQEITNVLHEANIPIRSVQARADKAHHVRIKLSIEIYSSDRLSLCIHQIQNISGIDYIKRSLDSIDENLLLADNDGQG